VVGFGNGWSGSNRTQEKIQIKHVFKFSLVACQPVHFLWFWSQTPPPPPGHFQNHENDNSPVYYALLGDSEASRPLPHSSKTKKGGVREGWMGGKYKLRGEGERGGWVGGIPWVET
jgi:hypothetical protein